MAKTEVYSWRLEPSRKAALEGLARQKNASVAAVLDEIVDDWLATRPTPSDDEQQRRLHEVAARHVGAITGGDPERATNARERIRARLHTRHDSSGRR